MLNKLKVMGGVLALFIPLWRPNSKKLPWKFQYVHQQGKFFKMFPNYKRTTS